MRYNVVSPLGKHSGAISRVNNPLYWKMINRLKKIWNYKLKPKVKQNQETFLAFLICWGVEPSQWTRSTITPTIVPKLIVNHNKNPSTSICLCDVWIQCPLRELWPSILIDGTKGGAILYSSEKIVWPNFLLKMFNYFLGVVSLAKGKTPKKIRFLPKYLNFFHFALNSLSHLFIGES